MSFWGHRCLLSTRIQLKFKPEILTVKEINQRHLWELWTKIWNWIPRLKLMKLSNMECNAMGKVDKFVTAHRITQNETWRQKSLSTQFRIDGKVEKGRRKKQLENVNWMRKSFKPENVKILTPQVKYFPGVTSSTDTTRGLYGYFLQRRRRWLMNRSTNHCKKRNKNFSRIAQSPTSTYKKNETHLYCRNYCDPLKKIEVKSVWSYSILIYIYIWAVMIKAAQLHAIRSISCHYP